MVKTLHSIVLYTPLVYVTVFSVGLKRHAHVLYMIVGTPTQTMQYGHTHVTLGFMYCGLPKLTKILMLQPFPSALIVSEEKVVNEAAATSYNGNRVNPGPSNQ